MIPSTMNILYATDLSANSAFVFRQAIDYAMAHNAKVDILYVLKIEPLGVLPEVVIGSDSEELQKMRSIIQKRVSEFIKKEVGDNPLKTKMINSIEVIEGDPIVNILEKSENHDMIVMGTHGKGLISHTFLGSVAEGVLQRSRVPVLVIPIPKK